MKDGRISWYFDTKYMTILRIEQILHKFEDQQFANFLNLEQVNFRVTLVIYHFSILSVSTYLKFNEHLFLLCGARKKCVWIPGYMDIRQDLFPWTALVCPSIPATLNTYMIHPCLEMGIYHMALPH